MHEINMDVERVLWHELLVAPKLVKEKFEVDCRFVRHTHKYCGSQSKLNHLRDLISQWETAK